MNFNTLPINVKVTIFSHFHLQARIQLRAVCSHWLAVIDETCRVGKSLKLFGHLNDVYEYSGALPGFPPDDYEYWKLEKCSSKSDDMVISRKHFAAPFCDFLADLFPNVTTLMVYVSSEEQGEQLSYLLSLWPNLTALSMFGRFYGVGPVDNDDNTDDEQHMDPNESVRKVFEPYLRPENPYYQKIFKQYLDATMENLIRQEKHNMRRKYNKIAVKVMQAINSLSSLTRLDLFISGLVKDRKVHIANHLSQVLPRLTHFALMDYAFDFNEPEMEIEKIGLEIEKLSAKFTQLGLACINNESYNALSTALKTHPTLATSLTHLTLCFVIEDKNIATIVSDYLPALQYLHLSYTDGYKDYFSNSYMTALSKLQNLVDLRLNGLGFDSISPPHGFKLRKDSPVKQYPHFASVRRLELRRFGERHDECSDCEQLCQAIAAWFPALEHLLFTSFFLMEKKFEEEMNRHMSLFPLMKKYVLDRHYWSEKATQYAGRHEERSG